MEVIKSTMSQLNINVSRDELLVINAALNEVCNGVELFEFETRIGASKARALEVLGEIGQMLDRMDA